MTVTINGTTGITLPNGSASAPAATGTDTDTGIVYGTNTVQIATGGTAVITVDSSQNVGVGTATPDSKFHAVASGAELHVGVSGTDNYYDAATHIFRTYGVAERMRIDSNGNLLFNSGYGSVATAYGCRAWVNFNGTGTVAIRASGNVSSITDNGTGNYTVNLTTAMPDANYAVVANNGNNISQNTSSDVTNINSSSNFSYVHYEANTAQDISQLFAAIFR